MNFYWNWTFQSFPITIPSDIPIVLLFYVYSCALETSNTLYWKWRGIGFGSGIGFGRFGNLQPSTGLTDLSAFWSKPK
jgi:hypothetical protein